MKKKSSARKLTLDVDLDRDPGNSFLPEGRGFSDEVGGVRGGEGARIKAMKEEGG